MFGNAPKALWSRWVKADERNCIRLACRALLLREQSGRHVLCEAGIGAFFSPELKARYGVCEDEHVLLASLKSLGLRHEDIDIVLLSHLHFDHAGGLISAWEANAPMRLLFPNARFIVSQSAWERALNPHSRDRASFIPELQPLLEQSGRLELVDVPYCDLLGDAYALHYSDGHTPGLLLAEIASDDGPLLFASDLIPGRAWVHLPVTMGYDRYPELVINEKQTLLKALAARNGRLFFTHDPDIAMARVRPDAQGRFALTETWATLDAQSL